MILYYDITKNDMSYLSGFAARVSGARASNSKNFASYESKIYTGFTVNIADG